MESEKNDKIVLMTNQVFKLVEAVLVFVIGLTLIISGSIDDTIGNIVGVVLILICAASLITDIIVSHAALTPAATVNAGLLALGILCLWMGIPLASFFALYLVVLGAYLVLEGVLTLIFKRGVVRSVAYFLFGAVLLTFGLLYIYNAGFRNVLTIIIGAILLVIGLLLILEAVLDTLHGLKDSKNNKKDTISTTAEDK